MTSRLGDTPATRSGSFPKRLSLIPMRDPGCKPCPDSSWPPLIYVLTSGQVAIQFKPEDGDTITVTEIKEGGVFGWSSALGRQTYTSCAVCLDESETLSLLGDELRELCATHPETGVIILERLAEVIASRLRNAHAHVVEMLQQGMRTPIEP